MKFLFFSLHRSYSYEKFGTQLSITCSKLTRNMMVGKIYIHKFLFKSEMRSQENLKKKEKEKEKKNEQNLLKLRVPYLCSEHISCESKQGVQRRFRKWHS